MKQIFFLASVIFTLNIVNANAQNTGTWRYSIQCLDNEELCASHNDELMVVISADKAAIVLYKNDLAQERYIIHSNNDTIFYVLDSLGEAYYASKDALFGGISDMFNFTIDSTLSIDYLNESCTLYKTSLSAGEVIIRKRYWIKDGEDEVIGSSYFPKGFIPVLSHVIKIMPLKYTITTEKHIENINITYLLNSFDDTPAYSYLEIEDGIIIKPFKP